MSEEGAVPQPEAPGMRSFSLNSREFHELLRQPGPPWRWGPGLPNLPRSWLPRVVPGVAWLPDSETEYPF